MKLSELVKYLPQNTIEFNTNGQVRLNLNILTNGTVTQDTSVIKSLGKLLQAIYECNNAINQKRQVLGLQSVTIVSKTIGVSEKENPVHEFATAIEVNSSFSLDSPVDPTI